MSEERASTPEPDDPTPRRENGVNNVTVYRVNELERRLDNIESKMDDATKSVVGIEKTLESVATKEVLKDTENSLIKWMLGTVGVTVIVAIGSLVVHVMMK